MRAYILLALAALSVSGASFATTITNVCKSGPHERRVVVTSEEAGKGGSCSVSYIKETDPAGSTGKVLWQSAHDPSFCGPKAEGFMQKLATMNFACSADGSAAPAAAPSEGAAHP